MPARRIGLTLQTELIDRDYDAELIDVEPQYLYAKFKLGAARITSAIGLRIRYYDSLRASVEITTIEYFSVLYVVFYSSMKSIHTFSYVLRPTTSNSVSLIMLLDALAMLKEQALQVKAVSSKKKQSRFNANGYSTRELMRAKHQQKVKPPLPYGPERKSLHPR